MIAGRMQLEFHHGLLRGLRSAGAFRQANEHVAVGIAADQNPRARGDVPIRQHRAFEHDAIAIH